MKLLLAFLLAQAPAPALAHHTADHIFEVARLALKTGNEGFVLEQSNIFFFEEEGSVYTFGFEGQKGARYKIVVVADEEVLKAWFGLGHQQRHGCGGHDGFCELLCRDGLLTCALSSLS